MMRSLYAGISGLRNHQTRMDVIGNNIANVNTIGFKGSRVNFQDMLSQTLQGASGGTGTRGGTNPIQIGMGMGLASIDTVFTDGSFQTTGKQTDLAISGQGFFILGDGANQVYSRAGGFDFDTAGNFLVPGTGFKVMGYMADSTGAIDPNQPLQGIQIPVGTSMPARTTTEIKYTNNLMSSAVAIGTTAAAEAAALTSQTDATNAQTVAAAVLPAIAAATLTAVNTAKTDADSAEIATNLANTTPTTANIIAAITATEKAAESAQLASAAVANDPNTTAALTTAMGTAKASADLAATLAAAANDKSSDAQSSITVYDSQGNGYQVSGTFEKIADNTWSFTPASTVKNAAGTIIANVTSSAPIIVEFNSSGSFKQSTASATLTIDQTGLIPASPYAGAGAFTVTPNFSGITQYGGATTVSATGQDGYASGSLEKTSINTSGIIVGQFSNGEILNLAQVALASFNNPSGLGKTGESLYVKTTNSGEPQIGVGGSGGRGSFNAGSLEMSNVDLAQQFSDMIVTQRGFQANSKIITTTDTMLEELVNLKR